MGGIKQVFDPFTAKRYIEFRTEEPTISRGAGGGRSASYRPYVDGSFDMWKFRRALHYVGLNATAHGLGVEAAHDPCFDAVRRYVRYPNRRLEHWPYLQATKSFLRIRDKVDIQGFRGDFDFVVLRIFNTHFGVDLRNTGRIQQLGVGRMPDGFEVVDASFKAKRSPKSERQYKLTIETNDGRVGSKDGQPKPTK